jgi:hypothetical protein
MRGLLQQCLASLVPAGCDTSQSYRPRPDALESAAEAGFESAAHSDADIAATIAVAARVFKRLS